MTPTTDTGAATVYTEVLPERAGKRAAIRWYPLAGDDTPQAGFVVVDTQRGSKAYSITEFPVSWHGRGFYFSKLTPGTDKSAEGYSVFCSAHGPEGDDCECRSSAKNGYCCHRDSARALLENLWV